MYVEGQLSLFDLEVVEKPKKKKAPGYKEDYQVICPYYQRHRKDQLICEGLVGEVTITRFSDERNLIDYKNDFCSSKCYKGCALYQALDKEQV